MVVLCYVCSVMIEYWLRRAYLESTGLSVGLRPTFFRVLNAFTVGNPFRGQIFFGFSVGRGFGVLKVFIVICLYHGSIFFTVLLSTIYTVVP